MSLCLCGRKLDLFPLHSFLVASINLLIIPHPQHCNVYIFYRIFQISLFVEKKKNRSSSKSMQCVLVSDHSSQWPFTCKTNRVTACIAVFYGVFMKLQQVFKSYTLWLFDSFKFVAFYSSEVPVEYVKYYISHQNRLWLTPS